MQLARVYQGRPSQKTLVLASIDGSHAGPGGRAPAGRGAARAGPRGRRGRRLGPGRARAAGRPCRRGRTTPRRAGIALQRTVAESIRAGARRRGRGQRHVRAARAAVVPDRDRRPGRAARLGLRRGADLGQRGAAARRQRAAGGDRPGPAGRARAARRCGRSPPSTRARARSTGPKSYVQAVSQVLPGWVLSLLAGTLLLPVLVASVDAFARARRRQRGRAAVAALARRLGRAVPGGARGGAVPGAGRRHALAAAGAGAARRPSARRPRLAVLGGVARGDGAGVLPRPLAGRAPRPRARPDARPRGRRGARPRHRGRGRSSCGW